MNFALVMPDVGNNQLAFSIEILMVLDISRNEDVRLRFFGGGKQEDAGSATHRYPLYVLAAQGSMFDHL